MDRLETPGIIPSSMSAANTVALQPDNLQMTGPGSPSIIPPPNVTDHLPNPEVPGEHAAVWGPDHRPGDGHPSQDGGWQLMEAGQTDGGSIHSFGSGGWKQL